MINITVCFLYIQSNFLFPATWQYEKRYISEAEQGFLHNEI